MNELDENNNPQTTYHYTAQETPPHVEALQTRLNEVSRFGGRAINVLSIKTGYMIVAEYVDMMRISPTDPR